MKGLIESPGVHVSVGVPRLTEQALSLNRSEALWRPRYIKTCTGGASDRSNHAKTHEKSALSLNRSKPSLLYSWCTEGLSDSQFVSVKVSGTS